MNKRDGYPGMRRRGVLIVLIGILALLAMLTGMCLPAHAAAVVDYSQKGSLTILEADSNISQKYAGVVVRIYKVGSFDTDSLAPEFTLTDIFAPSGVEINGLRLSSQQLTAAKDLASYAADKGLSSTAAVTTGADGKAVFTDLDLGLYLVTASAAPGSGKIVTSSPFLVSVPFSDSDSWEYHVSAQPKCTVKDAPPDLPQTGQRTAPIYILAGAGIVFVLGGLLMVSRGRKKDLTNYEKKTR